MPGDLLGVLEANVRHARRAAEILERLRAYVTRREPQRQRNDLNRIASNVVELSQRDLQERDVTLRLELSQPGPQALLDRVSIEQVVHNLVRNAAEAVEAMPATSATAANMAHPCFSSVNIASSFTSTN